MDDITPIDEAHAIMMADEDDTAARLGFFARLAAAELFLLLEAPAVGDQIEPQLAAHDGGSFALVFDREDRLTAFTEGTAPFAAMPGRVLAELLYQQGIGLALNPDVAPSSILLPSDAVDWLAETVAQEAQEAEARITRLGPPRDVPEAALHALDRRLAGLAGRAARAYLVEATYDSGAAGLLLAVVGATETAQGEITDAVSEVTAFAATPLAIDVSFFAPTDMALVPISETGLRFDIPEPAAPAAPPGAPGMDPDKPPRLR